MTPRECLEQDVWFPAGQYWVTFESWIPQMRRSITLYGRVVAECGNGCHVMVQRERLSDGRPFLCKVYSGNVHRLPVAPQEIGK